MTRPVLTLGLALLAVLAPSAFVACGNSKEIGPPANGDDGDDSGGAASSSGSAPSSSGSSSGGTASNSSGGGSSGSSGGPGGSSSGGSSSGPLPHDGGLLDAPPPPPYDGGPVACGSSACSLKTSTCCLDSNGNGTCVGHSDSCPPLTAGFGCLAQVDCSAGQVCCGVANTLSANTMCQTVAAGQSCSPAQATSTMGSAQLCTTSAECTMGQQCIAQTCLGGSNLRLCGLHNMAPFNCTAQ